MALSNSPRTRPGNFDQELQTLRKLQTTCPRDHHLTVTIFELFAEGETKLGQRDPDWTDEDYADLVAELNA
jgi:hypothetical protein